VTQSNGQVSEGLVVFGTGTVSAEPETANVVFGVELQGDDPAAIVEEAAEKIDQATAAAVELGVAEEDVRTMGYNLWVEKSGGGPMPPGIGGGGEMMGAAAPSISPGSLSVSVSVQIV